jgi:endoglucanase
MNIFRIQFLMERLVPGSMTGSYNEEYLANLTSVGLSQQQGWTA